MCTTVYMHGRLVANLGCSMRMIVFFINVNHRHVHVQCGVVVIDSRSYAACDVYTSTHQIVSIETYVNSPFHAVHSYLRL